MSPSEKKARQSAPNDTSYSVTLTKKAIKNLASAPETIFDIFELLREELAVEGPAQPEWPHYGMLKKQKNQKKADKRYHCHLKQGRPTWVACWRVDGKSIEIEVYFVGVHEDAPY